jgi:peptide subunit release factor 1 (eRF1)
MLALSDLQELAELSAPERAFLSVYLAGPQSMRDFERRCDRIRRLLGSDNNTKSERGYFDDDFSSVADYLNHHPLKSGALCFFSCRILDVFRAIPLSAPIEDMIRLDSSPFIRPLAEQRDEHATAAVVVADNKKARIFILSLATKGSEEMIRGNVKNHVRVGGWSQQRYERRRDNKLHKYALEIVGAIERVGDSEKIDYIVLVGSRETLRIVHENLPRMLQERVIEKAADLSKGEASINKGIMDLFLEREATTEIERWEHIRAEYLHGGLSAIGPDEVLHMAELQRIEYLIVDRTVQVQGMRCRKCHNLSIAPVKACSSCGSESLYGVEVFNEILDLTYMYGGVAHFIDPIRSLSEVGGIGAHLRY